jgi:sulfate adenylyltransferase
VELLAVGGFTPLASFMSRPQYDAVVDGMRLPLSPGTPAAALASSSGRGVLFGMPVVLDTSDDGIRPGSNVCA